MKPQNLLVIMSDEHSRKILGCYGNPIVQTPHLDALAKRGTLFSQAYTTSPICVPARAAFAVGNTFTRSAFGTTPIRMTVRPRAGTICCANAGTP